MADDKRIRELQTTAGQIPLNWRLPFDYTDLIAAEYKTMQLLVDTVNANLNLPESYTGATNPDNALGTNGSTYYKYVAGSTFGIWFKSGGVWTQFFEISLSSTKVEINKTQSAIADFGGGNWYIEYLDNSDTDLPSTIKPYSITTKYADPDNPGEFRTDPIPANISNNTAWPHPRIFGFPDPSTPQIITIYAI